MSRSLLDQTQIIQTVFDPTSDSLKVGLVPTELSFESSVITVIEDDGVVSCRGYERVALYGTGTVTVSAEDDHSNPVALTLTEAIPTEIAAITIKIVGTGKLVVQST